ncbi:ATP-dependent Clp endopeptidase proteolytic subunit ClpP [Microbacterium foliorum]|uniref:ATP-dependent Clp protease proteolytic subunit n=1 Tax=Microbacterium foliorum TaxID=104336 RepID=A0ABU1HPS0_9MICO|nr:head maturation protease, ClpP-related [Microbacterium foliorum]MDR6142045.1 ATP-dependent Clp endopeptidase proteolytic subunit ClpP [Microbacterium foliorum]
MNPFRTPRSGPRTPVLASIPQGVDVGNGTVTLRLYDPIDSYGGDWGVSAKEFAAAVDALPDGTTEILLLINSPGGEVWDGLAILNTLRKHPARVVAVVEGIAASAASFIAAGCDEMVMARNSEVYIHNAWGYASGDAEDMRAAAEDLDRLDMNLATIYAEKSGKTVDYWLAEMPRDRFMTAEEAVESGLADRIEGDGDAPAARARFDLSAFARTRGDRTPRAALPELPRSTEPGDPNTKEALTMSDTIKAGLVQRLGVRAEATDDEILAAVDEALDERAEPTDPATPAAPEVEAQPDPADPATPAAAPDGAVIVEAGALAELQRQAALGATAHASMQTQRHEGIVQNAINEGRIAPASRAHFLNLLGKDEAGTVKALATFPKGTIPVAELGHSESDTINDNQRLTAKAGWGAPKKGA